MSRSHRLLGNLAPIAFLAAIAPLALLGSSADARACDGCASHAAQAPIETTQLLVVKFHADWCGSCVQLDEPLGTLQAEFGGQAVDFVRLDLTSDTTRVAAASRAERLGLQAVYGEHGKKTGFALLIDAQSGRVLGELRTSQSLEEMRGLVSGALSSSEA